ncbi:MAG: aldehyde ferredoxin oxidoreductase family protein [Candidatus Hadarchaeum sp.]|uniref:aldehyde ferredoxin oxidoreductase family protein n=1 Tax=Candidatus Hadarchaeum sp. TaxID=2883567 RepID=UPI003D137C78
MGEKITENLKLEKILRVNLTSGSIKSEPLDSRAKELIGGKGVAAFYLLKELKPGVDPFSPENKLIFSWGPLTGIAPTTSRLVVSTKSPLTGTFLDSYSGGMFPAKLRFGLPNHVGIIFEGKAKEMCYLLVDHGRAELVTAPDLKGKSVVELYQKFGKGVEIAGIGIGGENMVRYATISSDWGTHHAGRGGAGAVMGSKNLKCVVVKSDPQSLPKEIKDLSVAYVKKLRENPGTQWAIQIGTAGTTFSSQSAGLLPSFGWKMGRFPGYDNISPEKVKASTKERKTCYNCPLACGYSLRLKGKFEIETRKGPEYETIAMMGPNCGIDDLSAIAKLDALCGEYGIDTIEAGNILGWLMRCNEEGIKIFDIKFGEVEKCIQIVGDIAHRKGKLGDTLADGLKKAVSVYGGGEFAVECKGMGYPGYDPRGSVGMALAYATSDRGACHKRSWVVGPTTFWGDAAFDYEKAPKFVKEDHDNNSVLWCLAICDFSSPVYLEDLGSEWLKALGYDYSVEQLKSIGNRVWNMVREFNVRHGFDRKDDYLPKMMAKPLEGEGPASGKSVDPAGFNLMLEKYYELQGWTKDGKPRLNLDV